MLKTIDLGWTYGTPPDQKAPKIALANRRDFLSQTSPSPAKPQWGRLFPRKESQSLAILLSQETPQGSLGGEKVIFGAKKSLRFFQLRQKIARNRNRRIIMTLGALRFWSVTIRGARPCEALRGNLSDSEGSQAPLRRVSSRVLRGLRGSMWGSAEVRGSDSEGSGPGLVTLGNR